LIYLDIENFNTIFAPLGCLAISSQEGTILVNEENIARWETACDADILLTVAEPDRQPCAQISPEDQERYTLLPSQNSDYFVHLSQSIVAGQTSTEARLEAILAYLAQYPYSTHTVLDKDEDPIENFLRQRRGGHCEMFASAFVMLCRAQGIPARYVGGYYAHEWNGFGKFLTVRACDAHAWTEVFIHGKGWITTDPTPAAPLMSMLREYRGSGELYREMLAEWLRRLWAKCQELYQTWTWAGLSLFVALFLLTALGLIRLLRCYLRHAPKKSRPSVPTPRRLTDSEDSLCLQKLWQTFTHQASLVARARYPWETPREYYGAVRRSLIPELQDLGKELVEIWELYLYRETPPHAEVLSRLKAVLDGKP
jgi:hypothetical protein